MSRPPWADAVRRARGDAPAAPARVAAPAMPAPEALSPRLAELMAERQRLESRMQAVAGGDPADPRFAVAPLADRRAELARWGAARDALAARLPERAPTPDLPVRATAAEAVRETPGATLRPTPGERVRPTPAELLPGQRFPGLAGPAIADRLAALREAGRTLSDAGRALRDPGAPPPRREDPLDRKLAEARDMVSRGRRAYDGAEAALRRAEDAIPRDWQERARERIPGLGRLDPYVREAARLLRVAVGTVDEIGEKADQLRDMARSARELKEADEAGDEARRERALSRLQARRDEGGDG